MKRTATKAMELVMVGLAAAGCTSDGGPSGETQAVPTPVTMPSVEAPTTTVTPFRTISARQTPGNDEQAAALNERMAKVQADLQAVNATKLQQFVEVINRKGYTDTVHFAGRNVRRYVVRGYDGTVYTDQLDYALPIGSPNNTLRGREVYVHRPGEDGDGSVVGDGPAVIGDPRISAPLDGKVDNATGYGYMNTQQLKQTEAEYDSLSQAALAVSGLEQDGSTAQDDYAKAVNATDASIGQ